VAYNLGAAVNDIRYTGSNALEGIVRSVPDFFYGLDETAQKAVAGVYAGLASSPALLTPEQDYEARYLEAFRNDLARLEQFDKQNKTLGAIISENVGNPLANLSNSFFRALEGDESKITNAAVKKAIAQTVGGFIAPAPGAAALQKAGKLGGSLLSQMGKGAIIGTGFGAATGGTAEDWKGYAGNVLFGTAAGTAAPALGAGLNRTWDYAKGTANRVQANVQRMTQDRNTQAMREIKAAQDGIIQKKNAQKQAQKPVQAESQAPATKTQVQRNPQKIAQEAWDQEFAKIEKETGRKLTSEQKERFKADAEKKLVKQSQTQARRQIASQKLKELKAQTEFEGLQVRKAGVEQQLGRIKEFLKERPKKLLPSEKQKAIRNKILRAQQLQRKLQEAQKQAEVLSKDQIQELTGYRYEEQDLPALVEYLQAEKSQMESQLKELNFKYERAKLEHGTIDELVGDKDLDTGSLADAETKALANTYGTRADIQKVTKMIEAKQAEIKKVQDVIKAGITKRSPQRPPVADIEASKKMQQELRVEILKSKQNISKLLEEKAKVRPKVEEGYDGSTESAIAEVLKDLKKKGQRIDRKSFLGFAKGADPNLARTYLTAKPKGKDNRAYYTPPENAKTLDQINEQVTEQLGREGDSTHGWQEEIVDFMQRYPNTPKEFYKDRAVPQYERTLGEIDQAIAKEGENIAGIEQTIQDIGVDQPQLSRQEIAVKNFLEKQNKALNRARKIQRTKVNKDARRSLGVEDPTPDALKSEVARLEAERQAIAEEEATLSNRLIKEAQDFSVKATSSEQFLKDQGLSYAGFDSDGKMTVASFDAMPASPRTYQFRKNGTDFSIKISQEGKPVEIKRDPTPVEKKWEDAQNGVHTQIDRLFGLADEPPIITKENTKAEAPVSDKSKPIENNSWKLPAKSGTREYMQPIQNVVDEISPNLGNKVAQLEADIVNDPVILFKELADTVGYRQKGEFDPKKFHAYLKGIFGDSRKSYVNADTQPENLTPEQTDLLIKMQPFFNKHKAELEAAGIDFTQFVNGLYAPRERKYNVWYNKQPKYKDGTGSSQEEIVQRIKDTEGDYFDSDMVMDELAKERKYKEVPDDALDEYHEGADSIFIRIKKIAKQRALNKFFGNELKQGQGHRVLIEKMLDEEGITGANRYDAQLALERLFDKTPYTDNPFMNGLNWLRYAFTLGRPSTAVKQPILGGVRYSARFGIENFLKGLNASNDPRFQAHMASIMGDIEKQDIGSKLKLMDKAATGLFRLSNQKEASLGMSSAYHALVENSAKATQGKAPKSFTDYMQRRYGDDAQAKIQKLAAQKGKKYTGLDKDILDATFTYARDRGSLAMTKADKVSASLDKNNLLKREFYRLLTYGFKNTNTMADMTFGEIKRGNPAEGFKNMLTQVMIPVGIEGLMVDAIMRTGSGAQSWAASGDIEDFGRGYERGGIARTVEKVKDSYLGIVPFLSRYSLDKLFDPQAQGEAIMDMVFKGTGGIVKTATQSGQATIAGLEASNRENRAPDFTGAFQPDLNPALKKLPPQVLTETYYNIVDPLLRGDSAQVVLDEAEILKREEGETPLGKLTKQQELIKKHRNAGVPEALLGTKKGQAMYSKLTNKKYQEQLKITHTFDTAEIARGYELTRDMTPMSPEERMAHFKTLSTKEQKAFYGAMLDKATKAYRDGKIERATYERVKATAIREGFPTGIQSMQKAINKVVGSGQ